MAVDKKREAIIEAAFKRFAHFGVNKTTMNEISDDLGISKASLYYYFPDKLNLFAAVLQKILDIASQMEKITESDPFIAMDIYLEKRTEFILKYQYILEYIKTSLTAIPDELKELFQNARTMEMASIETIITNGFDQKIFKIEDPSKTAKLFLDCLIGLRQVNLLENPNFFPDKKKLTAVLKLEKQFAAIFMKGLTVK